MSGSFLTKKAELSFGEADSQRRNPLGLSIKKYGYLWNSLYVKKYEYLWNRVVPAKSVLVGTKLVLFGRYILKFYVGIIQ